MSQNPMASVLVDRNSSDVRRSDLLGPIHEQHDRSGWLSKLNVNQRDPFFFDHPLDHVPGMLMICGMVELIRTRVDTAPGGRAKGAMAFRAMCELGPAASLQVDTTGPGRGDLQVRQGATVVADGWFEFTPAAAVAAADAPAYERAMVSADASLVHRNRAENIMIGDPGRDERQVIAAVLPPPPGHALAGHHPGTHAIEVLIEAGRQFATWLPHRFGGWPLDTQMLWIGVAADLPTGLPRSLPLALRWAVEPVREHKAEFTLDLIVADRDGPALGSLRYTSKALRPRAYAKFRQARGTA
jgi:hypothetical protein